MELFLAVLGPFQPFCPTLLKKETKNKNKNLKTKEEEEEKRSTLSPCESNLGHTSSDNHKTFCIETLYVDPYSIDPFPIRRVTSVPLGKGTEFALHHGKMSTTKRRAIQILHISMFQFTFKWGYNDFISKYTDINSLHVTQIDLLHNDTFAVLNSLVSERIFACKLSDDFNGFVDTCGTGKRNRAGALVLGNGSIGEQEVQAALQPGLSK